MAQQATSSPTPDTGLANDTLINTQQALAKQAYADALERPIPQTLQPFGAPNLNTTGSKLFDALLGANAGLQAGAPYSNNPYGGLASALSGIVGGLNAPQQYNIANAPIEHISPALVAEHPELRGMPLSVVHQLAPLLAHWEARNNEGYTLDQAATLISNPAGGQKEFDANKAKLAKLYPKGHVPKDFTHTEASASRSEAALSQKQTAADEKSWENLVKQANVYLPRSNTTIGAAAMANKRLTSARTILAGNPTNQQIKGIYSDIGAILKAGSPTEQEEKAQSYETLASRGKDLYTFFTGNPPDFNQPEIKARILQSLNDLQSANNQVISGNLKILEYGNPGIINKRGQEWAKIKAELYKQNGIAADESPAPRFAPQDIKHASTDDLLKALNQ